MSELTVHMLKYIVRMHICCPRIQNAENRIFRALKFEVFWGGMHFDLSLPPPPPSRIGGPTAPCWYSRLLYPNRWLLQFLLKPLVPPLGNSSNHDDSKGNKKIKKTTGLIGKIKTLNISHFLAVFPFPSLHHYHCQT